MGDMDFLLDDAPIDNDAATGEPWQVMIIDDDDSLHQTTKYALYGFTFLDSRITWIDAYSAQEAKDIVLKNPDIALIFLDVVMESDNAGLEFARWFREVGINEATRIILRTGQPDQAPEHQAIVEYDLHDYKTKTELTSEKLLTTTISALRSYRDLRIIEAARNGLQKIIGSMQYLFNLQSMRCYATGVLMQINALIDFRRSGIICAQTVNPGKAIEILAEVGHFIHPRETIEQILYRAAELQSNIYESDYTVLALVDQHNRHFTIYLENRRRLTDTEIHLLSIFCSSISVGFGNIKFLDDFAYAHLHVANALADTTRHKQHHRLSRIARWMGDLAETLYHRQYEPTHITPAFVEKIRTAAILYDARRHINPDFRIPLPTENTQPHNIDATKTTDDSPHDNISFVTYSTLVNQMISSCHERWDGNGYPEKRSGATIPVEARMAAITDVILANQDKGYSLDAQIHALFAERGTRFDPEITDAAVELLQNATEIQS